METVGRGIARTNNVPREGKSSVKATAVLLVRLGLAVITMVVAYSLGSLVMGNASVPMTQEETSQAAMGLFIVAAASALVLSVLVLRSRWNGLRLIGAVMVVHFGVETFMTQIETFYFNRAVQMESDMFLGIVAAGAVRAVVFAPLAVLILGKIKRRGGSRERMAGRLSSGWTRRFAALTVLYVVVYFLFGYFVAWQWEDVRLYYTGTSAIKPFFAHFRHLFLRDDPLIVPFQLLRGALWTALALLMVGMARFKRWSAALVVGSVFVVLIAVPLGLFPNPYMPPGVRQAHFYELVSSMLVYGGVAGWVLQGPRRGAADAQPAGPAQPIHRDT